MPGGPTVTPGTPNTKAKDVSPRVKIVVALYPFKAIESGDLSLEKNAEYEVIDDSQEHWWKVKDQHGTIGYIPSNYVKEKELLGLQKYDWYVGDMSRQRAESLLKQNDKEGCFVVRKSSTKGLYTLSLHTKVPQSHVKHYHIKQNARSVLMWEVFTCGKMPYGRLKNTEVVERVQRGIILEKPKACAKEIYDVMKKCWSHSPEDRPGFRILKDQLAAVAQGLTD
uniref:Tyrosine-protein kinase n=1 Tax=Anopheles coluzzii TaxID=1518534 RepID=A0A8W7PFB0_ANOCL